MEISHLSLQQGKETLSVKLSMSDVALMYLFFGTQDIEAVGDEFLNLLESPESLEIPITEQEIIGAATDAVQDLAVLQEKIVTEFVKYINDSAISSQIPVWSYSNEKDDNENENSA